MTTLLLHHTQIQLALCFSLFSEELSSQSLLDLLPMRLKLLAGHLYAATLPSLHILPPSSVSSSSPHSSPASSPISFATLCKSIKTLPFLVGAVCGTLEPGNTVDPRTLGVRKAPGGAIERLRDLARARTTTAGKEVNLICEGAGEDVENVLTEFLSSLGVDSEFGWVNRLTGSGGGSMSPACALPSLPDDGFCGSDTGQGREGL